MKKKYFLIGGTLLLIFLGIFLALGSSISVNNDNSKEKINNQNFKETSLSGYIYFMNEDSLFEYNILSNEYSEIANSIHVNELVKLKFGEKRIKYNNTRPIYDENDYKGGFIPTDTGANIIFKDDKKNEIINLNLNDTKLISYGWINRNEIIINEGVANAAENKINLVVYNIKNKSFQDLKHFNSNNVLNIYGITPNNKYLLYQEKDGFNSYNEPLGGKFKLFDLENKTHQFLNIPVNAFIGGISKYKIDRISLKNSQSENVGYFNLPYPTQTQACVTRDGSQGIPQTYWGVPLINCTVNTIDATCPFECRDCNLDDNSNSDPCLSCHENYSNNICHNDKHSDIAVDFSDTKFANVDMRVLAIGDGVLISKNNSISNGCGRTIKIQHKNGLVTSYCHFSSLNDGLELGQCINKGQFLGMEGGSGFGSENAYAKHIHIEQYTKDNFNSSMGNIYPTYSEHSISQPRQNLSYVSDNLEVNSPLGCSFSDISVTQLECSDLSLTTESTEFGNYEVVNYSCGTQSLKTGPERIYSIQAMPGNISITMTNLDFINVDLDLYLLDSLDPSLCLVADNTPNEVHSINYNYIGAGLKTFYIVIDSSNGSYGEFDLDLDYNCDSSCSNLNDPTEVSGVYQLPDNTGQETFNSTFRQMDISAYICDNQDIDRYTFSTTRKGELHLLLNELPANYEIELYADGNQVDYSINTGNSSERIVYNVDTNSTVNYTIAIFGNGYQAGNGEYSSSSKYNLEVGWIPDDTSWAGTWANTAFAAPTTVLSICENEPTQLQVNLVDGCDTNVGVTWIPSEGLSCDDCLNPIITLDSDKTYQLYTYSLGSTNASDINSACFSVQDVFFDVAPSPTANAGSDVTIQNGQSTQLQGSGGSSCSWSPTTGLINPNSCSPTASPSQTTTYTLTVIENGCSNTDQITVTVNNSTGGGNEPDNDNCNDAINLVSSTSCNGIFGSIDFATDDGFPNDPSCDNHPNPNTFGVFYTFIAVSNTQTVTVDPTGNLDAVVTLYTGNSCTTLGEFDCEDTSGGNGITTILTNNNFVIGQRYWVRVYDYGNSEPSIGQGGFNICVTHDSSSGGNGIDLVSNITNISDSNPDAGDQIVVNHSVINNGNQTMTGTTTTALYLSTNQTYGSSDQVLVGSVYVITENLVPNQSLNLSSTITIPNVSDGQYYIISYPDSPNLIIESDNDNNTDSSPIQIGEIVQNGPDLDIRSMSVTPNSNLVPGQEVDIEIRIENEGNQDANNFKVLLFLDLNGNDSPDNNEFMGEFNFGALDAGEDDTRIVDYDLPANIPSTGTYELFAIADSDNEINETNENNNDRDRNVTISLASSGLEDVTVINSTVNTSTVNAGEMISVSTSQVYLGNQTRSDLPLIDVGYYLSSDCHFSYAEDIFLDDDSSNLGVDNPSSGENQTLIIPEATPAGIYYILFVADSNNEIDEGTLENNNVECIEITINSSSIAAGDIFVTDEMCNPYNVMIGSEIEPFANINYTGSVLNADLDGIEIFYFLSTDCILSNDDIFLDDDNIDLGADLPVNDAIEGVEIPSDLSPGIYYILFRADATNVVYETNENNNIGCAEFNLFAANSTFQDVTLNDSQVEPTTVNIGDQIYMSTFQNYTGYQTDADLDSARLRYYLSTDCLLDSNDILLGSDLSSIGNDDVSNFENYTYTIPSTVNAGTYYILFVADADNIIAETDENNNVDCVEILINDSSLSINDNELTNQVKVYPNPVKDILNIELGRIHQKVKVQMFNVIGQKVNDVTFDNKKLLEIDMSLLSNGMYFLKVQTEENLQFEFKVIKE